MVGLVCVRRQSRHQLLSDDLRALLRRSSERVCNWLEVMEVGGSLGEVAFLLVDGEENRMPTIGDVWMY